MRIILIGVLLGAIATTAVHAAPGLGDAVYGATIAPGVTELETRYGRLTGGAADGEDALRLELSHGFSRRFYGAFLAELTREGAGPRRLDSVAVEGIVTLGRIGALGIDTAAYFEYEHGYLGHDKIEAKALFERARGRFDARLNLIVDKTLDSAAARLGYAASADWRTVGDVRLGAAAFGAAGDTDHFGARGEHYLGPILKTELERLPIGGELEIEAGYLFALPGPAAERSDGQARLLLSWERRF